jgi:hypothetical protein
MKKPTLASIDDDFMRFCWFSLPPSARARILDRAGKTTWLFGAGASHHYNLNRFGVPVPLASGFFEAFNHLPTSQGFGAHIGPLISFLEHYRGVAPDRVAIWNENIEDFMTSIEAKLEELRVKKKKRPRLSAEDFGDAWSYGTAFNNMNFIFANVLNESQNGAPTSLYHMLLETCGPNDSFITFNWDTLLDRALTDSGGWSPQDGYGVSFASVLEGTWKKKISGKRQYKTNWKLLKLHGSTNWLVPYLGVNFQSLEYVSIVPESDRVFLYWQSSLPYLTHKGRWRGGYVDTCYGYYPPNIPGRLFNQAEISAGPGKVFLRHTPKLFSPFEESSDQGVPSSPLLITPVRQKKYDMYASTIGSIWEQAKVNLATADKIVIVGYSFPPTDVRAIGLVRKALSERRGEIELEIVAPGVKDILGRIGHGTLSMAKTVKPFDMTFDQYLEQDSSRIPAVMREAAGRDKDVNDWVMMILGLSLSTAGQREALHLGGQGRRRSAAKTRTKPERFPGYR